MQPALLSLILIAVHVSLPVSCSPRPPNSPPAVLQQSSRTTETRGGPSARLRRLFVEIKGNGRKHDAHFLVLLPVKTASNYFVSIFNLKRKSFLCRNSKGKLHSSRQMGRRECLFQHIWSANQLLSYTLHRVRKQTALLSPSEASLAARGRLLIPSMNRQRRSDKVNPSDPLQTESHPPNDPKEVELSPPEQDQAGTVSKETISSCDDPLRVLQSNAPISPIKDNIAEQAIQQDQGAGPGGMGSVITHSASGIKDKGSCKRC